MKKSQRRKEKPFGGNAILLKEELVELYSKEYSQPKSAKK